MKQKEHHKEKETKQQALIKARKGKKEDKRQEIRKDLEKSSRLLDNYYDPKMHQRSWSPNGKVQVKNNYVYNRDTGLAFNCNTCNFNSKTKSNSNKRKNQSEDKRMIKTQIYFLEFDYMENNNIIITIEHCNNCEEHLSHTNHINDIYRHFARILQRVILLRFPFIKIYLKPIETKLFKYNKDKDNNEIRLGAMEIQYASKINDKLTLVSLHSKLNSGQWPSIYNVLNKISSLVPLINLKCTVFDKEEGLIEPNRNMNNDNMDNYRIDNILPTSIENIKVNLYLARNELIEGFSIEAMDELDIVYDPRRRQYAYNEQIKKQKNALLENNIQSLSLSTNNSKGIKSKQLQSHVSSSTSFKPNNTTYSTQFTNRPNSSFASSSSSFKSNLTYSKLSALDTLNDPDTIAKFKGKLLSSGYTDNSGSITFINLPYDSYLIEIEPSKNFLMNGSLTHFDRIITLNAKAKDDNDIVTINKYFGLLRQIDSYVEVYIYLNNDENGSEMNYELVNEAKVFLIRSYTSSNSLFPPGEDRLEVKENSKIKGRYEIITSPGQVSLEVIKIGYIPIKRVIALRTGENKINIELSNN